MKRLISIFLVLIMTFSLVACGSTSNSTSKKIYYLRSDKLGVVAIDYDLKATTVTSKVREVLDMLSTEVNEVDYINAIPPGVYIEEWEVNDGGVSLYLSGSYSSLEPVTEILVRAAIVKSIVQIEGVDYVSMYVDYSPLIDSNGTAVGAMTADMFIDDFGQETDSLLSTKLVLYYASADGMSLVPETREVYYSRNVSLEKLVVEQLLKGPDVDGRLSTIPNETKLISISVTDDICYVNFDGTIETAVSGITENVTIYSIVNSLCELTSVKGVQLLVNGETPHFSNIEENLSNSLSFNQKIINDSPEDDQEEYLDGEILLDDEGNPVSIEVDLSEEEETVED